MSRRPKKKIARAQANAPATQSGEKTIAAKSVATHNSENRVSRLRDSRTVFAICIFLAAAVWFVFGQTIHDEFVNYDDGIHVYDNAAVKSGLTLKSIAWAFTFNRSDYWHPLDFLSHMLDCQLYGLNPAGHHLSNVLLHAAVAVCLFLVLRRVTGALWRSAFVSAVFAIHPLRVESVAWVSERKDMLHGLFFVLAIGAYVHYARKPWSLFRYGLVVLLFALGLMSKPTLMTLPFLLLLLDYWPLQRFQKAENASANATILKKLIVEKIPLFVMSAASCVQAAIGNHAAFDVSKSLPRTLQIANAITSYVAYVWQMVWPARLAIIYPFPAAGLPFWEMMGAIVLLAVVSAGAVVLRRRRPYFLVGWLWYLGMLVPMIGFWQAGSIARADRYTYLPQIGLYLALTWMVADFSNGLRNRRMILGGISAAILAGLVFTARVQATYWRNNESLWTHAIACTSGNAVAHYNLATDLLRKGRMDEAIIHYQEALQINPKYLEAHNNLGNALLIKGRVDEAISHFQEALQIDPDNAEVHHNIANVFLQKGRVDEAITHYQKALQLDPNRTTVHNDLGNALFQKGNVDEAIVHFEKALQINPDYATAHNGLGLALLQKEQLDEAIVHFKKASEIDPDYAEAHYNLGNAFLQKEQLDEAVMEFQKALQIEPDYAEAHNNLGNALRQKGMIDEATAHFQTALKLQPANFGAQNNLAWMLITSSRSTSDTRKEALQLAEQANRLSGGNPIILRTLAAAFSETGHPSEALSAARSALQLAETQSKTALAAALRKELARYEAGLSFRDENGVH